MALIWIGIGVQTAAAQNPSALPTWEADRQQAIKQGLQYLAEQAQQDDGMFSPRAGSGITALAVTAALRNGRSIDDPMVARGLAALETFVKPDGGIYGGGRLKNYETCVAMVAFAEANTQGQYRKILADADAFVRGLQIAPGNLSPDDPRYGGVGYGGAGRPDLSNTGYFIEALRAAGAEPNDAAIQRAILFVNRCQNLDGQGNDTRFAELVRDGGFYYSLPTEEIDPDQDPERFTPQGGLRSYGTMTYAGMKSLIYAGVTKDDPRVKAAMNWIQDTYSVEKNPGMGDAGLYYYYHTFGKALSASGLLRVQDQEGKRQTWRADLVRALVERQSPDGSWTNDNPRWMEHDPSLATSFALLALSYCEPPPKSQ